MAAKKDYKQDVSGMFISNQPDEQPEERKGTIDDANYQPPAGYKLKPETKSKRMLLLVTPRVLNAIDYLAKEEGVSRNAYVNKILWDYLTDKGMIK